MDMKRRLAASLTLAAAALVLLGLPLVIGAAQSVHDERFIHLAMAALVACTSAVALATGAQVLLHSLPQSPQRAANATMRERIHERSRD